MATAVAVAYTFPVCLRYIAVEYRFLRTPLMIIPPMTYFLVVVAVGWKRKNRQIHDSNAQAPNGRHQLTRVNLANVLDEGVRIGGRGCQINSKVKISQKKQGLVCVEYKRGTQLAQSQSVPGRPLLAPLYR
jgi:hypothetical protein